MTEIATYIACDECSDPITDEFPGEWFEGRWVCSACGEFLAVGEIEKEESEG